MAFPFVRDPLTNSTLSTTDNTPNGPLANDVSSLRRKGSSSKNQHRNPGRQRVLKSVQEGSGEEEASAIYFNHGDLGFGRNMHMTRRGKLKKNLAFYVTNYRSLEDAIDRNDPIATVAMEYSFGSKEGKDRDRYIQFFAFGADGNRIESADLDGRGEKDLPGLCVTCHGGNLGSIVPEGGDIGARFLPFDLNAFDYSESNENYTRAAQESAFKTMNLALLDAYPTVAVTELIQGWYASSTPSLPSQRRMNRQGKRNPGSKSTRARTQSSAGIHAQSESIEDAIMVSEGSPILNRTTQNSEFVPVGWRGDHEELYTKIVAPYCRGCHMTRVFLIDWNTYEEFAAVGTTTKIKHRVCQENEDTMPNAKATYQNMWLNSVDPIDVFTRHNIFEVASGESCGQGPWARP